MLRGELDRVWKLILKEKTKKEIGKELGLSPQALSNHLSKLEKLGCIKRQGKYLIQILPSSPKHPRVTKNLLFSKLNKRGHAFNIKVYFPQETELWSKPKIRQDIELKNLEKLKFGSLRMVKDKTTIWINKETLTLYSNNSYYSQDALQTKFLALKDIDTLIVYLKDKYNLKGKYGIEIFREHYGLIFNKFAEWLLKQHRKMYVQDKGNRIIYWVDDSLKDDKKLKEFEGDNPIQINKADNYFKALDEDGWKTTPSVVNKKIEETKENLNEVAELVLKASKTMLDSELRNKQMENRLNGYEELLYQIINKLNDVTKE